MPQKFTNLPVTARILIICGTVVGVFSLSAAGGALSTLIGSQESDGAATASLGTKAKKPSSRTPYTQAIITPDDTLAPPRYDALTGSTTKIQTEQQPIAFDTKEIQDPNLQKGVRKITTTGINGVCTVAYQVVVFAGKTTKTEISRTIVKQPVTQVATIGTRTVADPTVSDPIQDPAPVPPPATPPITFPESPPTPPHDTDDSANGDGQPLPPSPGNGALSPDPVISH